MPEEPSLLGGSFNLDTISARVLRLLEHQRVHKRNWLTIFLLGFLFANVLMISIGWLFQKGIGIWGTNIPTAWAIPIASFVWWIGIGHAGTFISAFLFLMRQRWRDSINRTAEAMTIFAVLCAGMYPVLHLGRPWVAYWLAPYPNQLGLWPQFRSPLVWDFFAVSTYLTVSLLFWGVALVPDFATIRDRAKNPVVKRVAAVVSFGWSGSADHWARFEQAYLLLAGLATALVVSVHSIVGLDFAVAQLPGWHSTIIPPYFVAGAIFSGFAMLLVLLIPIRAWYGLKEIITMVHIEWMARILLLTALIVAYSYATEIFMAFYGGNLFEVTLMRARFFGDFRLLYFTILGINAILPQVLWSKRMRQNIPVVFAISLLVVVGMWLERYEIVTVALRRDFLPSSWGHYAPTLWDWATLLGTVGFFVMMMFLFIRFAPVITTFEIRELLRKLRGRDADVAAPEEPEAAAWEHHGEESTSGLVLAFYDPDDILAAANRLEQAGLRMIRAFTPYAVKGLAHALGFREQKVPWMIFIGGVVGAASGYGLQYYINVVDYPLNSGGRPFHSFPAFVPVTYECTILFASLTGVIGMFTLNRLPRLSDPIFEVRGIERATQDRFLLFVSADDPKFDPSEIRRIAGVQASPEPEVVAP